MSRFETRFENGESLSSSLGCRRGPDSKTVLTIGGSTSHTRIASVSVSIMKSPVPRSGGNAIAASEGVEDTSTGWLTRREGIGSG